MLNNFEHKTENIYITKTGRIETCRRKEKGLPCSRHEPLKNMGQLLTHSKQRVMQKLTPFERKLMKFLSLISNTKEAQLREEYAKIVAQHYLNGVRTPNSEELKGLQKLLLETASLSPDVEESRTKKWFKNATLGESFTTAGFWGARDLLKRTLGRVKNFFAGGVLASTLFVTSCAPGAPTQTTQQEYTLDEYENLAEEGEFVFDEEFMHKLIKDPSAPPNPQKVGDKWALTFQHNYDYNGYEIITDELGSYKVIHMSLPEPYIEAFPVPRSDRYSEDEFRDALRFYTNYALNDFIDSPALDNAEAWYGWWETRGQNFVVSDEKSFELWGQSLRQHIFDGKLKVTDTNWFDDNWTPMVLYAGAARSVDENSPDHNKIITGLLIRDGESRTANKQIHDIEISIESEGIWINGIIGVGIAVDFKKHVEAGWGADERTRGLKENEVVDMLWGSTSFGLYLILEDDGWKIAGYGAQDAPGPNPYPKESITNRDGVTFDVNEQRPDLRYVGLFN